MPPARRSETDLLIEQIADGLLDHDTESARRHAEMAASLARIEAAQTSIRADLARIERLAGASPLALVSTLLDRATASTAGTVALLALIAVLTLIGAAAWVGSDRVLEILAARLSGPTLSPPTPEVPHDAPAPP